MWLQKLREKLMRLQIIKIVLLSGTMLGSYHEVAPNFCVPVFIPWMRHNVKNCFMNCKNFTFVQDLSFHGPFFQILLSISIYFVLHLICVTSDKAFQEIHNVNTKDAISNAVWSYSITFSYSCTYFNMLYDANKIQSIIH